MHFIGIDIGTTSICGIVYNFLNKKTISVTISNESAIESDQPWEKIQNPEWIITCIQKIIKQFESEYDDIRGIGITGQMHGNLYVNDKGDAVSPLYTWQDNRGSLILHNNTSYVSYLGDRTGYHLSTGYGLVTHFYNVRNSLLSARAVKFCNVMDYAVMKLTGKKTPLVGYTNAAGIGFFNVNEKKFYLPALDSIGVDTSILPKI